MKYVASKIRSGNLFQTGVYQFKVSEAHHSKADEKLSIRLNLVAEEPASVKGRFLRHTIWLGTNADPQAEQVDTQHGYGFSQLRDFVKAIGLTLTEDTEEDADNIASSGASFLADVTVKTFKKKDGSGGEGNELKRFYAIGRKQPAIDEVWAGEGKDKPAPVAKVKCPQCSKSMSAAMLDMHLQLHDAAGETEDEE